MIKFKLLLGQWLAKLTRKLNNNFYIYLATVFTLLVLLDASVFHVGLNMRDKAFDFMVKYRVIQASADPQIVIVDINEASLAAFSKEYGRWPWPRQVLGEFVENIQAQKPKSIVFDIVFSDADIYNSDSDAYFNDVIGASDNVFFPILRLDPSQDKLSQLKYAQIPGIRAHADHNQNATIAAILPFIEGARKPGRLGTHNVYPDNDGIVREYRVYHEEEGWRLPSLPAIVGKHAGGSLTHLPQNMLINWRGKPFSFQYVSFSDVFTDLTSQRKTRPQSEFTDKIVIIGSTAPGLFDIKPTAMDKQFPGVEILATAIDNVKHGDYLKVWRGKTPYIILSLVLIWATTLAFYFKVDRDKFNSIFTGSQVGLLALSYIGINVSNTYLDLTAPILWAVALFGIAKIYALATDRALQRWLTFGIQADADHSGVLMMAALIESDEPLGDVFMKKLKHKLELASGTPNTIEVLLGTQTGIWGLFGDMVVVSWIYSDEKPDYKTTAQQDAQHLMDGFSSHIEALGLPKQTVIRYAMHDGKLLQSNQPVNSQLLGAQWRTLFAQLILQLELGQPQDTKESV
ncbi:MAG: molecular chaperone TorD [Methylophilaceae bacterium 17-44-8]|jgi:CHASE2 domain-containing sensor protein|nr:MAG: molecular chaperone TorD [Methylophilales bacterium 28-44-11]OZA06109.1 MAG: molecular chaperone TorD [Methylophilaceae bacterium 17-44-8]